MNCAQRKHWFFVLILLTIISLCIFLCSSYTLSYAEEFGKNELTDNIPKLNIDLHGVTLEQINAGSKDIKYEGNEVNILEKDKEPVNYENVQVKGRGNSTWLQPKKPYQIKFDSKVNLFNLGKSKKWVLLANALDASNIRNDTTFNVAKILEMEYSWGGQFINLYVDNKYIGLYWLTHKVEIGSSTVDLGDEGIIVENDNYPPDDIFFTSKLGKQNYVLSDTSVDDSKKQEYLNCFHLKFDLFEEYLYDKNWTKIKEVIDVESFAKYCLIVEFTYNIDSFSTSTYYYQNYPNDLIHCGPVWDFDQAYCNYLYSKDGSNDPLRSNAYFPRPEILSRMMDIPEFREEVELVYKNLFIVKKNDILSRIDNISQNIYKDAVANNLKWKYKDFDSSVELLKNIIESRFKIMDLIYLNRSDLDNGYYSISCNDYTSEDLYFEKQNDGFYLIFNAKTLNVLQVKNSSRDSNSEIQYGAYSNSNSQKWLISKIEDSYYIVSKATGLVVNLSDLLRVNQLGLVQNQKWHIETLDVPYPRIEQMNEDNVVLSWDNCKAADSYTVFIKKNNHYEILEEGLHSLTYKVNSLVAGQRYNICVCSVINGSLCPIYSRNTINFRLVPSPVSYSEPQGDGKIKVTWNNQSAASYFSIIEVFDNKYYVRVSKVESKNSVVEYTLENMANNFNHCLIVQAFYIDQWSPYDDITKFTYAKPEGPTKPKNIIVKQHCFSNELSWDKLSGAEKYSIAFIKDDGELYYIDKNIETPTYIIKNLEPNKQYKLVVLAYVMNSWTVYDASDIINTFTYNDIPEITNVEVGSGTVTISWGNIIDASAFAILQKVNGSYKIINSKIQSREDVVTYTINNLPNGFEYTFIVQSFIDGVWSKYKGVDEVIVTPEGPVSPYDIDVEPGYKKLYLNWGSVPGATKYSICSFNADGTYDVICASCLDTNYVMRNLPANKTFKLLVQAFINNKWSTYTDDDFVYGTPTGISIPHVTNVTSGDGFVEITWDEIAEASCYAILEVMTSSFIIRANPILPTGQGSLTYKINNLSNNKTHKFVVQSLIDNNWSTFSDQSVYIEAIPSGPVKPYNITGVPNFDSINLSWGHVSGASKYSVVGKNSDGTYSVLNPCVYTNSCTLINLVSNVTYTLTITAFIDGAWSSFVDETDFITVTTSDRTPVVEIVDKGSGFVKFRWNNIPNAKKYAIVEKIGSKYLVKESSIYVTEGSFTEFTLGNLSNKKNHYLIVQSFIGGIWSTFTDFSKYKCVNLDGPTKPTINNVLASSTSLKLTWDFIPGAIKYSVSLVYNDGTYKVITSDFKGNEYLIEGLKPNTQYRCLVTAFIDESWSEWTIDDTYLTATLP